MEQHKQEIGLRSGQRKTTRKSAQRELAQVIPHLSSGKKEDDQLQLGAYTGNAQRHRTRAGSAAECRVWTGSAAQLGMWWEL